MAKPNLNPQSATPQAKVRTIQSIPVEVRVIPRTFSEAIAAGFAIDDEHFRGELSRRGHFTLKRIDTATGDCERISVPFTGKITVGRLRGYRVHRHAYLTPEEVAEFQAGRTPASA